MEYKKVKLSECCKSISDGDHLPPPKSQSGVPFITISNIDGDNQIDFNDTMFVPDSYYDSLSEEKKARIGDILYSVVGSFGKPVFIDYDKRFVFQRHIAILKPNDEVNSRYLYYVMLNPDFYYIADKIAIGAAQRTITLNSLRNMTVNLPDIAMQNAIVDVLSCIDKKIQCNKKINDNVQQQLKLIYDYWFTQFDFPDENGKPYRSSGGAMVWNEQLKRKIPIDWRIIGIKEITDITWGQCPEGKNILDRTAQGDNVLDYCSGAGDMKGGFLVDCQAKTDNSKRLAYKNDILVSIAGKIGDMCVVDHTISLGRAAMAYTVKDKKEITFVYLTLQALNRKMTTISTGSIQKVINSDHINDFLFPYQKDIVMHFGELTEDIFSELIKLSHENRQLVKLRDWLLPMLMNGQATISD